VCEPYETEPTVSPSIPATTRPPQLTFNDVPTEPAADDAMPGFSRPLRDLAESRGVSPALGSDNPPEESPAFTEERPGSLEPDLLPRVSKGAKVSTRAGLFFLIAIMERLDMPRWIEENPVLGDWPIPKLVLRDLAIRLETPLADPALAALGELPGEL